MASAACHQVVEVHDAQHRAPGPRHDLECDLGHKGQRAFGAGDELGGVGTIGCEQLVEVVAAGAAPVAGKIAADVVAVFVQDAAELHGDLAGSGRRAIEKRVVERDHAAVCQHRLGRQHVVGDHAVQN